MPDETARPSEPTVTYQYSTTGTRTEWPRPQWPPRGMPAEIADQLRIEALERRVAKLERWREHAAFHAAFVTVALVALAAALTLVILTR